MNCNIVNTDVVNNNRVNLTPVKGKLTEIKRTKYTRSELVTLIKSPVKAGKIGRFFMYEVVFITIQW